MSIAKWHASACFAPRPLRHWLTDTGSMTAKLRACCHRDFRVRLRHQGLARIVPDEAPELDLPRHAKIVERDVVLLCDGRPVLYGHTAIQRSISADDWPCFGRLGERPLGSMLFTDPQVARLLLRFARLQGEHVLRARARDALAELGSPLDVQTPLYARRCLFLRKRGVLLLTEILLPEVINLRAIHRLDMAHAFATHSPES